MDMHGREIVVARIPLYCFIAPSYIQGTYPENFMFIGVTVFEKSLPPFQ